MEIWKKIPNSYFEISNYGRIASIERDVFTWSNDTMHIPRRIRTLALNNRGYYTYNVRGKSELVHRLVAEYFVPNPNNYPVVNHKDCNQLNNGVDNLEWCTQRHNVKHCVKNRKDLRHVSQYTLDGEFIRTWPSLSSTGNARNVANCCDGRRYTAGGYIWKWHNE